MKKIFYVGLEAYQERYTFQLTEWTKQAFEKKGVDFEIINGNTIDNDKKINVGQVLDAHGRCYFALSQMMNIVQKLMNGEITANDVIFFEDMFHPGIESLPYIFNQIPDNQKPQVFVRCLAQSIDPDDFVNFCGMTKWMGLYEKMVNEFAVILASNEEMVANIKVAGWTGKVYNISGLSFGKDEVQSRVDKINSWDDRKENVIFSARWDQEKQPNFFMDIIEELKETKPEINFLLLQGNKLKSNNSKYIERARKLEKENKLIIKENLTKNEYYNIINQSKVLFNCALQDWTSNTVSEADALGCNVVFPAYRSFPEIFNNDESRLYVPWSKKDAIDKILSNLQKPNENLGKISDWTNGTIDRIVDIINGNGEHLLRDDKFYREKVSEDKY